MRIKVQLVIFILLASLSACVDNDIVGRHTVGKEGDPAEIFIQFLDLGLKPNTRGLELTEEEEKEIKSLFIFVFDEDGKLISSTEHIDVTLHGNGGSTWNPIPIHSIVGNDRQIYAVANYNSQVIENIKSVESLDDLNNLVVQNLGNPLSQEQGIIKVGSLTTDIRDGNTYQVPLKNLVAKVTIKVVNKCKDFSVEGWTIDGFPLKSYVIERQYRDDNLNYHDAPDINNESDFYNEFSEQSFAFDKIESVDNSATTYSITGYCFENRRGKREKIDPPPPGWPYGDGNSGDRKPYQEKAWYAPKNATRVKIIGRDESKQRDLFISHYLGENNTDDYNVSRGNHYTYTITINSLSDIDIDTNVEQYSAHLGVYTPPDLMNIDAHSSMRMFQLFTNQLQPNSGTVSFEVLSSLSTETDRPDWLKVAMFPLINFQVKGGNSSDETEISKWQQDGIVPGYYARSKFIPHKSVRAKISGYQAPNGIIFGDENSDYPDNDDVLPFEKSIRRMCYKITNIPIPAEYKPTENLPTSVFVYADEFEYSSSVTTQDYREAIVRVTYTPTGKTTPEYTYYNIRQYRPNLFRSFPGDNAAPLLIERTEDYNNLMQQVIPLDQQLLNGLQWGPSVSGESEQATSPANGFLNTAQSVYTDVAFNGSYYTWSNERTKFGSNTGGWKGSNGAISQVTDRTNLIGKPYYMFNLSSADSYNTVYNTTAARYCHEKNADINGDGIISPEETVWYLPSEQELQMMWTYNEILGLSPAFYWSSTRLSDTKAYAISMRRSPADVDVVYNGVPQERPRTGYKEGNLTPPRVRCVRRADRKITSSVSPMVNHTIDGRSVIDCSNLSGEIYTTTSKMGISQKEIGKLQNANTKIFRTFEVQRAGDNNPVTYAELIHGTGKCNESQGWRLPTQREMLLIWSVKDKLEANSSFTKFKDDVYWTMLRVTSGNYMVDFKTGLAGYHVDHTTGSADEHKHYYRCVREL